MSKVTTIYLLFVFHLFPLSVFAEGPLEQELNRFFGFFNPLSPFLGVLIGVCATLCFFYFFWGLTLVIQKKGQADEAKNKMLWGFLGVFVLISVWGLVALLQNTVVGGANFDATIEQQRVKISS